MRNKQTIIDAILSDMKEHFKEAKKYQKRKDRNMTVAAFKNTREDRDKLLEFMTSEEARQLYVKAYEEIFEAKEKGKL